MNQSGITPVTSAEGIVTVAQLAREIWSEYYVPMIGQTQIDYMLGKFQSTDAIEEQIREGYEYFLIHSGVRPVGYFAVQSEPPARWMFLSKFYVHKDMRGQGLGSAAMEYIQALCKARGLYKLWLTANKKNPAVQIYQRLGFEIVEAVVTDIGSGYVMDDYRMEKVLA